MSASTCRQQYAQPDPQLSKQGEPVLVWCWSSVADSGPELDQHWVNVLCLLGVLIGYIVFRTSLDVKILKLLHNWLSLKTIFYCRYKQEGKCDSSNNNIWARFYESSWWPFWILLDNFYHDRLIGISHMSFLAAILKWNFRLQTSDFRLQISEVPTELLYF